MIVLATRSERVRFDKRATAQRAMLASIEARSAGGFDLHSPVCVYSVCEALGVTVRFNDINMEGMYDRLPKPRIHLSALRPIGRRAFNCAHELGHHAFGHGSTIDELREERAGRAQRTPDEFLVEVFAAFVLMPTLGVRRAFAIRGLTTEMATAEQIFAIASDFGVGYSTLVNHLAFGIRELSRSRSEQLLQATPKTLRQALLDDDSSGPLVLADEHSQSRTFDTEVGTDILLPMGSEATSNIVTLERELSHGTLFRAARPGIVRMVRTGSSWAIFVRVCKRQYVGLARYRHLEEVMDE